MRGLEGIIVVKCGGTAAVRRDYICAEVAELVRNGEPIVLVHGGSDDIDRLAARLGVDRRMLTSPSGMTNRHTTPEMLNVVTLALAGQVKPQLVAGLRAHGARPVGVIGADGGVVTAARKAVRRAVIDGRTVIVRDDHSGRIEAVDPSVILTLLGAGYTPVVSPPAIDSRGNLVNVDADRIAAALAVALGAEQLLLLTGAPGVMPDNPILDQPIDILAIPPAGVGELPASGGMRMKLVATQEALVGGVPHVLIADGRRPDPVRAARSGRATRVVLQHAIAGVSS